ncbi:MAG TPA: hypothetical protein VH252_04325, partial [Chthoniobacterales bacterium]|nr:hypothetical protein [Chthoniobacterales bacterium]
ESGIDFGVATINDTIKNPDTAWAGWTTKKDENGSELTPVIKVYTSPVFYYGGEGNHRATYTLEIDSPASLNQGKRAKVAYRIRATGFTDLPGARTVSDDRRDVSLRRLSLVFDKTAGQAGTGKLVTRPQATRTIEVVALPRSPFNHALGSEINYKFDKKVYIDGYDSRDGNRSIDGLYDISRRTTAESVFANRWKKKPRQVEKLDLGKATIYGDVLYPSGKVKNAENVKGRLVDKETRETETIAKPDWLLGTDPTLTKIDGKLTDAQQKFYHQAEEDARSEGPAALMAAKAATQAAQQKVRGMVLNGGSEGEPTRYKLQEIKLDNRDESLIISNPPGATESWIELWVTKDIKISKGAVVLLKDGVHATIHFEHNLEIKDTKSAGGGFIVESGFAGDLQFYGIEAPDHKKEIDDDLSPQKRSGKIKIEDADFAGVIDAPDFDIEYKPKDDGKPGDGAEIYGSFVGRKVKIGHGANFHYDQALEEIGKAKGYQVVSYIEDTR